MGYDFTIRFSDEVITLLLSLRGSLNCHMVHNIIHREVILSI